MEGSTLVDQNMASQLALRVALQTMKERCISLQKRLNAIEEENQALRDRLEFDPHSCKVENASGSEHDSYQLRTQVAELSRQKLQLSEHINMVSAENRKLWSRLSQIAKDQNTDTATSVVAQVVKEENSCTFDNEDTIITIPRRGSSNLNLIRSKTFTQHSPNPNLRHKVIPTENTCCELKDVSLEEVPLDTYEDNELGAGEAYAIEASSEAGLGFSYFNVEGSGTEGGNELNAATKKCVEGLECMRREALLQQQELNSALSMLQSKMVISHCQKCKEKPPKPETADKSLETDESLSELKLQNTEKIPQIIASHLPQPKQNVDVFPMPEGHLNILQEKLQADELDKICPMCGKIFSSSVLFNAFREHVETHFIDDSTEMEPSMERNFEFISHAVGDF